MEFINPFLKRYRIESKDVVPEGYYSITDILSTEKIHQPTKKINEMRRETLRKVLIEMDKENTTDLLSWWYNHINNPLYENPYGSDVIWFMKNYYLAFAVKLIEVFLREEELTRKNSKKITKVYYVSFGIRKDYFDRFFQSGGKDVPEVKNKNISRSEIKRTISAEKYDSFHIDGKPNGEKAKIPRVPEYQRWKDWCKLNKVKQSDAMIIALNNQVEENPHPDLPPIERYTKDAAELVINPNFTRKVITIKLSEDVYKKMRAIILAYNKKEKLDIKGEMTNMRYADMAIEMLNNIMAKEYLYKDELENVEQQIKNIEEQEKLLLNKM